MLALIAAHLFDFYRGDARNLRARVGARAARVGRRRSALPVRAGHARLRAGGMQPVPAGRGGRPRGAGARSARALGDPRRGARDGDAGPPPGRRRLAGRAARRLGRRQRPGGAQLVAQRPVHARNAGHRGRRWRCTTRRSAAPRRPSTCSGWTPRRCCGGCGCWVSMPASAGGAWPTTGPTRWRTRGYYAFNDAHALMALLGAGDATSAHALLERCHAEAGAAPGAERSDNHDNRAMATEVGLPLMAGLAAFHRGDMAEATARLASAAHRGAPLRRQPRPARPDRADAAGRLRRARRRPRARPRPAQRAPPGQAGDAADAALGESIGIGAALTRLTIKRAHNAHPSSASSYCFDSVARRQHDVHRLCDGAAMRYGVAEGGGVPDFAHVPRRGPCPRLLLHFAASDTPPPPAGCAVPLFGRRKAPA